LAFLLELIGAENRLQIVQSVGKIVIDDQVIVVDVVAHFADGFTHAAFDDRVAVLAAVGQALVQGFQGRRQDEDRPRLGHQLAHLLGALPVDFQDQVVAFVQGLLQVALRGAVEVAEHFGALKEGAVLDHLDELGALDEVIVNAVHLARAHGAGGVGHRDADLFVSVGQGLDQAALARARGAE